MNVLIVVLSMPSDAELVAATYKVFSFYSVILQCKMISLHFRPLLACGHYH